MSRISKSRLLATSAIVGLSIGPIAAPVAAQDSFGIHNDQPELLEIIVEEEDADVEGLDIGVYADNGPVTVDNAGEIRGLGTSVGSANSRPSGGIVIAQPGSSVTNRDSGEITGGSNGIATSYFFSEDENDNELPPEARAADTAVTNSGLIRGEAGSGVALAGGGSVTNSGTIQGLTGNVGNGAQGIGVVISEFADRIAEGVTGVGIITNSETGLIEGTVFGALLQGGGTIDNAGIIRSTGNPNPATPGVSPFGIILTASPDQVGRTATVNNSGTVSGFLGILAGGSLDTAVINNSGTINAPTTAIFANLTGDLVVNNEEGGEITSNGFITINSTGGTLTLDNAGLVRSNANTAINIRTAGASITNSGLIAGGGNDGIYANADGVTTIDNAEAGVINGAASGIHAEFGGLELTNAGTIHGDGVNPGFDAPPDAGVTISGGVSSVTNSGSITGNRFGITTANYFNPATGQLQGLATGTTVVNSGNIYGYADDGVRLIGGGSVTNSGEIGGQIDAFADGVSMFAYTDQANEDYSALVTNEAEGRIIGVRFGVILSGGGEVINDGEIIGASGGVYIQGTALNSDPNEERSGLTANVVNRGTITGLGDFGGTGTEGYGVGFGSDMSSATLVNSGTISSDFAEGVSHGSLADLTITNEEGGVITGATSGIYSGAGGTLTVDNAGTIRGDGVYDGFDAPPDAGITIGTAASSVTNSGTISGAGAGISTTALFDEEINALVGLAVGTEITNSGSILGEANDGVRLIGGGTVTNSGSIRGEGTAFSDGVSMYAFTDQANEDFSASVVNAEGGEIEGSRFGIILSGGGAVENAGDVTGVDGGMFLQGTAINTDPGEDRSGLTASVVNSGTITGTRADEINGYGVGFGSDLSTATLDNSGTISSVAAAGVFHGTLGDVTINNSADGVIEGAAYGVYADGEGTLDLNNAGTIQSAGTGIESTTQTNLVNSGTITGDGGIAVQLGAFDDNVTLGTGSAITGLVDAGDGTDTLTLDGDVLELTEAQQLTAANGFEALDVAAGYWSTSGFVGEFGNVTIDEGASLQVNEVDLGEEGTSSPILTSTVRTDGLLVLNFGEDETVSALDDLTIDGAGQLQLIGDAVFTVDTANIAHTGGTIISNGGLVLTGVLQGDVRTEGDGYFELGAGGTEGSFSGNIVNNGRFVFNRSDNYDFLGDFSGNGALDKMGDGTLTFMGDYAFEGVTNILGGSVRIGGTIDPTTDFNLGNGGTLDITGKDQTIGGLEGQEGSNVELGDSELTVDQPGNTAFGGSISGTGSFVKQGEGTLNLTGDSTYTGPTSVNGGTLAVNGSIVSPVTVNSGGTLGGNGSVGSTTVGDGGTIAPGNSIGRLTVNGDLAFAAGSTYEVEVNAAGEADRLDATGAVTIDSTASVAVLAEDGEYNGRTDYVILTGAGGITGTFGTVTSDLAFLDPLLRYDANSVILSLYRNDIDFADIAIGFNQASVATAVQALGIDNPLYEAVLVQNAATAQASFGDLSGEILASAMSGLTDDSRHLRNSLMGMKAPAESGAFVWGSAFGGWGDFDANRGNFAMDTDHKGLVAGVGFGGNGFAAALSAGIGGSDFRFDGRNDRAEVDSKYLAAHATYGSGEGLRGTVGVSYAWHDIDTSRGISGAPLAQTLTSKRDADTLQIFGEIGYDITAGNTAITPFARLAHVDTGSDAFTETGGNAALTVGKADQKTTFLSLGARAQFNAGQPGFQPYLSAAWNRAFNDRGAPIVSRFVAGGPAFDIIGIAIPKNSAEVEAGFEFTTGAFRLGAAYTGTLASDRSAHGARVTARIAF
ncbi:autotransporter domain-containing protein [Sphingopyxis sp.]|uniref:autotransporter domain-containing protein n=1 Tax=Sphingopyxis sp. TaxID=1908224 RepID=UPI002D77DE1E|nr:autotransporter domain-containing protein [Sphingopyxis sp.]HET6526509.1 autotransporter domain-containing protein [Sphingopyxis sp.]